MVARSGVLPHAGRHPPGSRPRVPRFVLGILAVIESWPERDPEGATRSSTRCTTTSEPAWLVLTYLGVVKWDCPGPRSRPRMQQGARRVPPVVLVGARGVVPASSRRWNPRAASRDRRDDHLGLQRLLRGSRDLILGRARDGVPIVFTILAIAAFGLHRGPSCDRSDRSKARRERSTFLSGLRTSIHPSASWRARRADAGEEPEGRRAARTLPIARPGQAGDAPLRMVAVKRLSRSAPAWGSSSGRQAAVPGVRKAAHGRLTFAAKSTSRSSIVAFVDLPGRLVTGLVRARGDPGV